MCSPLHASLTVCRRRLWQRCSTKATTWGGPSLPTAKVGIIEYRLEDRNQSVQKRRLARLGNQALEGRLRSASAIPQLPVQTVKVRIKRCLERLQVHHTMDSTSPRPGFKGQGHPMLQTPFLSVTTLRHGGPLPTSPKLHRSRNAYHRSLSRVFHLVLGLNPYSVGVDSEERVEEILFCRWPSAAMAEVPESAQTVREGRIVNRWPDGNEG